MPRLWKYAGTTSTATRSLYRCIRVEPTFCRRHSSFTLCLATTHNFVLQRNNAETQRVAGALHLFDFRCYRFVLDISKHTALSICVMIKEPS